MSKPDLSVGKLSELKQIANESVVERDGQFAIELQNPIPGIDDSKLYPSRELAVDAAFNLLKSSQHNIKSA